MLEHFIVYLYLQNNDKQYIGHFESCSQAQIYMVEEYPNQKFGCFPEDYVYLPEDVQKKLISLDKLLSKD